jgi:hypothetical protein
VSRIVLDGSGSVYLAGVTSSTDFPTQNPIQSACASAYASDVFLTKLDSTGANPVSSTCLGGTAGEALVGLAVDASGSLYVAGITYSGDFPTRNPVQAHLAGGPYAHDAFLAKLSPPTPRATPTSPGSRPRPTFRRRRASCSPPMPAATLSPS